MKLLLGDCKNKLKELEDNSIDSIVTDPPYGISFMGKKWDYDVPQVEVWKECLRVLKPGGYLLSFAGTRTQHRMAVNIEDAGFEIRDMIAWVYGSGFPKSMNISKAIDNKLGAKREVVGQGKAGKTALGQSSGWNVTYNPHEYNITTSATDEAKQWEGWGTALKPALEPITVARKPLEKGLNVAENCLKWGVGGINIDGCRVGLEKISVHNAPQGTFAGGEQNRGSDTGSYRNHQGRFPANLIHDGSDEVVGLFPNNKSSDAVRKNSVGWGTNGIYGKGNAHDSYGYSDSGSASRFFYCAKASKRERNIGCEDMEEQIVNDGREKDIDNAYQRGTTLRKNTHPTVKPVALMEYLVKLVSREGHTVLDPFMGSGTTGMACKKLGRDFVGIEMEEEYIEIAKARIEGTDRDKPKEQLNLV